MEEGGFEPLMSSCMKYQEIPVEVQDHCQKTIDLKYDILA